jgi:hypothetical protein
MSLNRESGHLDKALYVQESGLLVHFLLSKMRRYFDQTECLWHIQGAFLLYFHLT